MPFAKKLTIATGLCAMLCAPAGAQIFSEDFQSLTAPGGNFNGAPAGQVTTNHDLVFGATLAGWSNAGAGSVHAVDTNNTWPGPTEATPNWGVMIWQDNVITQTAAIAGSNENGTAYRIDFLAAGAVYEAASQVNNGTTDHLKIEVLRAADSAVLHTFHHTPAAPISAGDLGLLPVDFTYTGDGSGDIRFRIGPGNANQGRFQGTIDDLTLSIADPATPGVASFTATPDVLGDAGDTVTFDWLVSGLPLDSLVITPGDIDVLGDTDGAGEGSFALDPGPGGTTEYTLTAGKGGVSVERKVTVTLPAPAIVSFDLSPAGAGQGEAVMISWEVGLPATTLTLAPGDIDLMPLTDGSGIGSLTLNPGPDETTTYTLTATRGTSANTAGATRSVIDPNALFFEDFESFTAPPGNFNGDPSGQVGTGLDLAFSGSLAGWNKAGAGTVHIVDSANLWSAGGPINPRNFAVMIWQDNIITQAAGIAGSNDLGTGYVVDFLAAPAVYELPSQATGASEGILIEVLRSSDDTVLHSFVHQPGAFAGNPGDLGLSLGSFTYTGDGSGDIKFRIAPSALGSGRFGGAIDDLQLSIATPIFAGYSTSPAVYVVGQAIAPNGPLNVSGVASGFTVTPALPAGLSMDPTTGIITGTPSAASPDTQYTITASFPAGQDQAAMLDLTVLANSTLTGYSRSPATYVAGTPITPNTPKVVGAMPSGFAISPDLPSGLAFDTTTGVITGTPTSAVAASDHTITASFSGEPDSSFDLGVVVIEFASTLLISEFVASNDSTLDDGDGNSSDWIEIHNFGATDLDLAGWYLTDRADNLSKWRFPSVVVPAGGYLVVFASNQSADEYVDGGGNLHTNFSLSAGGEFLGLVEPDGMSIAHSYAPAFPPQVTDIAYGLAADLSTVGFFNVPTPGAPNASAPSEAGPLISMVTDSPQPRPADGEEIVITAQVDALLTPVASVTLHYRVMFGGEIALPMSDSGGGQFSATIPHAAAAPGEMIRWYVTAEDSAGESRREPPFFAATDSPEYFGTVISDAAATSALPTLHWFTASPGGAGTRTGTRSSVLFNGEFYDNVFTRVRGASSEGVSKKSYKFEFNTGHHFRFAPGVPRVGEINVNTTFQDKAYIRPQLSFESYAAAGVVGSEADTWRVQQNGSFFSVASFVEQVDADLLDRNGLDPEGALYKMFNGVTSSTSGVEKKTRRHENNADLQALVDGIRISNPDRSEYLFDHIDIPSMINYATAGIVSQDFDRWAKNFYVYRDTNGSGEWSQIPHDKDLTFGNRFYDDEISGDGFAFESGIPTARQRAHPFQGAAAHACCGAPNLMIDIVVTDPRTREMYLRRLRTLMDEQLQPPGTPVGNRTFETRIDELEAAIAPDAALDLARWGAIYGSVRDFPTAITLLKNNYLDERRVFLYETHAVGGPAGSVGIPDAQPVGVALAIGTIDFNPSSGSQEDEYIELTNPNSFAVDVSGWTVEGAVEYTFKPGTVIPSSATGLPLYLSPNVNAFRARGTSPSGNEENFVQGNYRGQLSARGETITIRDTDGNIAASATYAGAPSDAQQFLRITELHYHPADPTAAEIGAGFTNDGEFEFVELKNIGPDPIDIGGVRFEGGIDFVVPGGTTLAAGEHAVVVSNGVAFEERYGAGINVIGQYSDRLSNDGEQIVLRDAVGENILKFTYNDRWYPATDGDGYALVILDDTADWSTWDLATSWGIGEPLHGSPGAQNSPVILQQYEGWLNQHFSEAEIDDPLISGRDADPNGDGRSNFDHYAFGTDPRATGPLLNPLPTITVDATTLELTYRFRDPALDLEFVVEQSGDLSLWSETAVDLLGVARDGALATATVRAALPGGDEPGRRFVRVVAMPRSS